MERWQEPSLAQTVSLSQVRPEIVESSVDAKRRVRMMHVGLLSCWACWACWDRWIAGIELYSLSLVWLIRNRGPWPWMKCETQVTLKVEAVHRSDL
jgi:hypothetical protein